jgi:hypothetical protein
MICNITLFDKRTKYTKQVEVISEFHSHNTNARTWVRSRQILSDQTWNKTIFSHSYGKKFIKEMHFATIKWKNGNGMVSQY